MTPVEEIKQKIDIVDLIGGYVDLKKAGRNYRGLCPFHGEKTPSFMVSPELQIFKCFGCGKGGDIFTFHQEIEGVDFPASLEVLAEKAGVKLEKKAFDPNKEKRKKLHEINSLATQFYHYILTKHKVGKKALKYLKEKRELTNKTIEDFMIGYSPSSWDSLYEFLVKKKYKDEEILAAGLIVPGKRGGFIDKFRGRIVFPFTGIDGKVVGFNGRVLDNSEPKYLNSPETEVFHKSTFLFGLDKARVVIKKEGAVLVEGQMDVLSAHQAGIENIVAATGTSLTAGQLNVLSKYTKDLTFAFDSDFAGDKAIHRSIDLAESQGFNIKVGIIPEGAKDLDEVIKSDPKKAKKLLEDSVPVFDFFLVSVLKRFDVSDAISKKKAMGELAPLFGKITDPVLRDHYVKKISDEVGVSESVVSDLISRQPAETAATGQNREDLQPDPEITKRTPEEFIMALILKLPIDTARATLYKLGQKDFVDEKLLEIFTELKVYLTKTRKKFDVQAFSKKLSEETKLRLDELYLWDLDYIIGNDAVLERELEASVEKTKKTAARREMKEVSTKIKQAEAIKDKVALGDLTREFRELSEKLK